jgi:hypothetical protein
VAISQMHRGTEGGLSKFLQSDGEYSGPNSTNQIPLESLSKRSAFHRPGLLDEQQHKPGQHQYVLVPRYSLEMLTIQ